MKKNRWALRLLVLLLLAAALNVTFAMAAGVGSSSDPLVTLSYLNTTYLNTILGKVDAKISTRNQELTSKISQSSSDFKAVTLAAGKTLTGTAGCEVLLRTGKAVCVSKYVPGLVDETAGTSINGGAALSANHLYLMTTDGRGVKASVSSVLLVRGSYTVS
jgi:hypothetical protein